MLGVIVNTVTVLLGSSAGLLFKRGIPPRISQMIIFSIGLCSVVIGVKGSVGESNSLVLLAGTLVPVLTEPMIAEIAVVGSALIIALGLNVLGFKKLQVANFLPAVLFAPFFCWAVSLLPSGF